ncbi:putative phosphodiesterase [Streptomonospora nanhaiensis]|uniref:Putative phosphodiesterase n=1 Tax=Streptomonospora nanhaiensis TaxID=1323731 RepID=A0A853BNZ9_9ACTN|nr:putative phosphodiesterase [Streptomonospora nanhaiensis]
MLSRLSPRLAAAGRALPGRFARLRRGRAWRVAAVVAAGLLGGWLGLLLGGQVVTPIGPADIELSVSPDWNGETVLDVSPLGKLEFDTHAAPLRFEAGISEIRFSAAEEMFQDPEAIDRMAASIGSELRTGVIRLFVQAVVAAVLGAALTALAVFRDWRRAGFSALTALAVLAGAGGLTYATFNPAAIAEPRYTGLLAGAPQVVGSAENVVNRFSQYREQLAGLVGNVSQLYEATSALPVYENDDDTVRVLHVSDIHLNPASWNVIRSLTEQFQIDVVVDTGDITDRGSAAEDVFVDDIGSLDVPYVWVRGAHDSMGTQRAVEAQENAVVLDGDTAEVRGITFYGAGDPRFSPDQTRDNPGDEELAAIGAEQAEEAAAAEDEVDIAVLHDRAQAEAFSGRVPLVLTGHGHNRWTEVEPTGTRFFAQGSTGGAGLRGLDRGDDDPTPYEASVLYIDPGTDRLQAWDDITLGGLGLTSAQIERHIEEDPDRALSPPPPTDAPTRTPTPSAPAEEGQTPTLPGGRPEPSPTAPTPPSPS